MGINYRLMNYFFFSENLEAEERKLKIAVKRKQMILIHETYSHY